MNSRAARREVPTQEEVSYKVAVRIYCNVEIHAFVAPRLEVALQCAILIVCLSQKIPDELLQKASNSFIHEDESTVCRGSGLCIDGTSRKQASIGLDARTLLSRTRRKGRIECDLRDFARHQAYLSRPNCRPLPTLPRSRVFESHQAVGTTFLDARRIATGVLLDSRWQELHNSISWTSLQSGRSTRFGSSLMRKQQKTG